MRQLGWVVFLGLLVGPVWGQETERLQFFDCGTVRFFGEGCRSESRAAPGAPPAVTSTPPPAVSATPPPATAPASPPDALFTPETMAPDTPPLLLQLLQEPTEAHAQAFLDWQRARVARIVEVQALLQQLGQAQGIAGREARTGTDGTDLPTAAQQATVPGLPAPQCLRTPGAGVRSVCALRRP